MRRGAQGQGGWTLLELLVVAGLCAFGLSAALSFFTTARSRLDSTEQGIDVQQSVRIVMERCVREVRESAVESVVITGQDDSAIAFALARSQGGPFLSDPEGCPVWQQAVVYYQKPGTSTLYRYSTSKSDWSTIFDPTSTMNSGLGEVIWEDGAQLQFTLDGSLLDITLEVTQDTSNGVATRTLTTQCLVRNAL